MLNRSYAIIVLLMLLSPLMSISAMASTDSPLEITLPCSSQNEAERRMLFKQGLSQILVRVSSDPSIVSHDNVLKANAHILDYVEQYCYEGDLLKVTYYENMVTDVLRQIGTQTLMLKRPKVIVWLALEATNERHLVGAETDPHIYAALNQFAKQYDVPLVLPLMDLEDVSMVTVTDVWGQFTDVLSRASQRYAAPVLLVGRLKQVAPTDSADSDIQWQADWTLRSADNTTAWHVKVSDLNEMWPNVIQSVAKRLHELYAVPTDTLGTPGKPLLVGIQGITTRSDFQQVAYYLQQMQGVNTIMLRQVNGHSALFEVFPIVTENKGKFAQRLNHEQRLVVPAVPHQSLAKADLIYEWEP